MFDQLFEDKTLATNYLVNVRQYMMDYYLTDDIYPKYATHIQTVSHHTIPKERLFASKQEVALKISNWPLESCKLSGVSRKDPFITGKNMINAG